MTVDKKRDPRWRAAAKGLFYTVLFWCLLGFILIPMINTVAHSFSMAGGYGVGNYVDYFHLDSNIKVIANTLTLGVLSVFVCGAVGTFLAVYMHFLELRYRRIIHTVLLSPMMVPGVIIVIAFIQLYGESGLVTKLVQQLLCLPKIPFRLGGLGGILFVHGYTQYVYFYLNVSVALKYVDYSCLEAARGLGASKRRVFFTVLLPALTPALIASSILTFISGIGSFSAPVLIGGRYRVLSTQIMQSKANNYLNLASMQVVILMLMGLTVMLIARYYEGKAAVETSVRAVPTPKSVIGNPLYRWMAKTLLGMTILMIVLPIGGIFLLSFVRSSSLMVDIFPRAVTLENYIHFFSRQRVLQPFLNSVSMAALTVFAGLLISVPAAYLAARRRNRVNRLVELLIMLPWSMPVSTIAINLINTFNVRNPFTFNQILVGTFWMLPMAYVITGLPLLMRTNIVALESFNQSLEDASRSLGATMLQTFARVTVPMVSPAILAGGALIFIRTLGEYTLSALLYGVHNRPIAIAMVNAMQEYDIGLSMTYGVMTILICFAVMGLIVKLDKEKYLADEQ